MSPREPRWDIDYQIGIQGEMWASDLREALQNGSVEVKNDKEFIKTGNIYVEYECKRGGIYQPSGIKVTTALAWMFVLVEGAFGLVFATDTLIQTARNAYRDPRNHRDCVRGGNPTHGVIIPLREIRKYLPAAVEAPHV